MRDVRFNQCLRAYGIGVGRKDQTYKNGDYALFFAALIPLAIIKFKWISDRWIKNLPDLCIYLKSKTYLKKRKNNELKRKQNWGLSWLLVFNDLMI